MTIRVEALVVPYDSGFEDERMGAGPRHLVRSGVLEQRRPVMVTEYRPERGGFRGEIASAFDILRWLATRVASCRERGSFPLVLAGNCMAAVGIFAGLRSRSRKVPGVLWFDAHGDFNTPETSESGFLDGMAVATLTGRCWTQMTRSVPHFRPAPDASVLMFGTRNLDSAERAALSGSGIHWPRTRRDSVRDSERLESLRRYVGEVYVHVDLDVLDEGVARANEYASPGGMTSQRLIELLGAIGKSFHIAGAAIAAYDPTSDPEQRVPPIARQVVETIVGSLE